jgi:hypothetical protein
MQSGAHTRQPTPLLQRKCGCGGGAAGALTGECDDCQKKKLQRQASAEAPGSVPPVVDDVLAAPGDPIDPPTRRDMEARFGHDFGDVRIHTDGRAGESARSVGALAYTVGSHVVFGANQYAPATPAGRHLLAHELAHTIQQQSRLALQRQEQPAVSAPADPAEAEADRVAEQVAGGFLVDDEAAPPGPSQMRKSEFLSELQSSACASADAELARVGRSTEGCPFVEQAIGRYRTMPAARVEQAIRRYADVSGAAAARDYIPLVSRRIGEGVARWATTGEMTGVPPELAAGMGGGAGGILGMLGGGLAGLVGGIGRLLFKRDGGNGATRGETAMVATQLGGGAPLESGVRGRMESAFGYDFSHVRIHSGHNAAAVSSSLGARAFTLGRDVGFAAGEYRPNTVVGDALIAHELAHVVQQSSGSDPSGAVEEDADESAVGAMMSIWTGAKQIARSAMPRLRSGLGLQRCSDPSPYPRHGIVIRDAAPLRSAASFQPPSTLLADLPRDTRVKIVDRSGTWLKVEVTLTGRRLTGFVPEPYIDDLVAHQMEGMVGQRAAWVGSGPSSGNTFERWASAATETAAPPLTPSTSINCWEMILYAAYRAGVISWSWIHDLYVNRPTDTWVERMTRSTSAYSAGRTRIPRGSLVFFDGLAHVAMATGNGDEVYTFWPPPNTPFDTSQPRNQTVDRVKISTIAALSSWWTTFFHSSPAITYGQPSW